MVVATNNLRLNLKRLTKNHQKIIKTWHQTGAKKKVTIFEVVTS